ncbi:hypothetical protein CHL76_14285 [Marinococcus halophilus]|uniref:Uncharacterized protein n=1 Tax=Marinococcus halophilus TaxID=1371 RepID=A0A510Y9R7_MARHA|nr:hypothetical protein [Marinococcus halophilus]OZT79123.1 hypothetical protein CHL76_14285 [Marinococcus halophilus]GEK59893.1 hypothetical protein MHA01_27980 [Marinococcus halophilus]
MDKQEKQNEHLSGALLAFILLIFIPVFLSNIIFAFSPELMGNSWKNFFVVLVIDLVLIWSYASSLKDVEYRIEKVLYLVLLALIIVGALSISIAKLIA